MSRLAENLIDIFKVVGNDETLLRLLYYKDNPLDETKTNVKDLDDFIAIRTERILRSPKADDLTDNRICRICMYFGNGSNVNDKVTNQDVCFEVYAHIDEYDLNDARALLLVDRVNGLINDSNITGIGRMRTSRRRVIGNAPKGYIGYWLSFEFGSIK